MVIGDWEKRSGGKSCRTLSEYKSSDVHRSPIWAASLAFTSGGQIRPYVFTNHQ
jgi:hypothetical protein